MSEFISSPLLAFLLIAVGIACLFLELFIPSLGILGIVGGLSTVFGIYSLFAQGHTVLAVASIAVTVTVVLLSIRYWLRKVSLKTALTVDEPMRGQTAISEFVGLEGVTISELRPAGIAAIGGHKIDVISSGGFIPKGAKVQVTDASGNRVLVKLCAETSETTPPP